MCRSEIRDLKKVVKAGASPTSSAAELASARTAALSLLDTSIRYGHRKLAIRRLADAVQVGASVSSGQWQYCDRVVSELESEALRDWAVDLLFDAMRSHRQAG